MEIDTVYPKIANGSYYFRYQINGQRKAVSLKTKNQKEAIIKAKELTPVVKATTTDVISAHVKQARGLATCVKYALGGMGLFTYRPKVDTLVRRNWDILIQR